MNNDEDIQLLGYRDDSDHKFTDINPFIDEESDDPLREFRIPREELKEKLD